MYAPPRLGLLPPPLRPRPRMSAVLTRSFPPVMPSVAPDSSMLTGYGSKSLTDSIFLGLGGGGIAYLSKFLPGIGEPIAMVGGLGLAALGVYKFYSVVSGEAEPDVVTVKKPKDQTPADVQQLTGKIMQPTNGGAAELSSMWTAVFQSQRTFRIRFAIINRSQKPVTALVEVRTEQTSRPWVGEPETYEFSTDYVLENIAPGDTKIKDVWQPIHVLGNILTPEAYRSQDVVARLFVRDDAKDPGKEVDTVKFTAF
jgi:hypothetical protein